ncbi:hypothetical protein JG687_00015328 [Phytophthora cactorum]|uniref:Uncharacterized protein n=1 Tax=Phytophthora cactorum TaxID=29920 RepID=A0A8T1TX61_9STRA|nr:hypothetical protein JG687_00015328 [Phytophthora cactorum]
MADERVGNVSWRTVTVFRTGKTYMEQVYRDKDILVALGFAWNRHEAVWNQQVIPGIRGYAEIFKSGNIPIKFVVPSEEPWPESAWGTKAMQSGGGEDIPDAFVIPSEAPWPEHVWGVRLGLIVARNESRIALAGPTKRIIED